MQPVTGWLIDRVGTRMGFALIMAWWSVAAATARRSARVSRPFAACRFLLGAGRSRQLVGMRQSGLRVVSAQGTRARNGTCGAPGVRAGLVISVPIVAWISLTLGLAVGLHSHGFTALCGSRLAVRCIACRRCILPSPHAELRHISEDASDADSQTARVPISTAAITQCLGRDRGARCSPIRGSGSTTSGLPNICGAAPASRLPISASTRGFRFSRKAWASCSAARFRCPVRRGIRAIPRDWASCSIGMLLMVPASRGVRS